MSAFDELRVPLWGARVYVNHTVAGKLRLGSWKGSDCTELYTVS